MSTASSTTATRPQPDVYLRSAQPPALGPERGKKFDIEKGKCPYGDTFHIFKADRAWGLWSEGGAMGNDDSGKRTFQLWPAKEYAALSEPSGTGAKQSEESP